MSLKNKISSAVFYFCILIFIIASNFSDNRGGGWLLQLLPDLHGASIIDITFTDSLTGYAVTKRDLSNISYVLKTSNGGDNWNIQRGIKGVVLNWNFLNNPNSDLVIGAYFQNPLTED